MMRKNISFYRFIALLLFFTGCKNTDLTPAYIVIDEETLINCIDISTFNETHETNYDNFQLEALKSQRFSAVWVTINNGGPKEDVRGVWELPCKIPVLASGNVTVKFQPAYYKNGRSDVLPGYRMVSSLEKTVFLEPEKETRFTKDDLIFTYAKGVIFPLLETFQDGTSFERREEKGATIESYHKDGRNVGLIELKDSITYFDILSPKLPLTYRGINYTLLEIEYKIEYSGPANPTVLPEFTAEVRYTNTAGYPRHEPLVNFIYSKEWKTVYVDLASIIGEGALGGTLSDLRVCLTGVMPENEGYSNVKFFFDNIKITTY